jgi:ABC-2 type transport system ATP-binding protein
MADSPNGSVVQTQGLTKVFTDFWLRPRVTAVEGLDLAIRPREVFGLLGPNGSGKSTTLKLILGLLFPTRGRIAVFGRLPTDTAVKARLGYLPEESNLYRFLNARETLDFYGRLFRLPRRERRRRADMLLEMVGLEAVQRRPVGEYSKGMQRRIGLAQALINDPDLLILDEPTSGLDPLGTRQVKDLILKLRERGKTVLLSSHLLADVEDLCDRVSVLYGGRCRAAGTVQELLAIPGSMLLQTDPLSPATIGKIKDLVQSEEHKAVHRVETPRKKLETLFLEIVHKAQEEGAQTSGARAGAGLAAFLAEQAAPPPAPEGRAVVEHLTKPQPPAPPPEPAPAPKAEPDKSALEGLLAPPQRAAPPSPTLPVPSPKPARATVDRSVIDELLDKGNPQ